MPETDISVVRCSFILAVSLVTVAISLFSEACPWGSSPYCSYYKPVTAQLIGNNISHLDDWWNGDKYDGYYIKFDFGICSMKEGPFGSKSVAKIAANDFEPGVNYTIYVGDGLCSDLPGNYNWKFPALITAGTIMCIISAVSLAIGFEEWCKSRPRLIDVEMYRSQV